jgi:5'-methylthioadenosine phosphorylase
MKALPIPQAVFAIISGSAGWGVAFPEDLGESGVTVVERELCFDTPWGESDGWQLLEIDRSLTPDAKPRLVLNVFSHGWPLDGIDHGAHRRVAWVLAQAGTKKVLADSTCGSLNKALQPRDLLVASDVIDLSQTQFSLLGGRFQHLCVGAQLFCPALGKTLEATARELWPQPGRVYGLANRLVVVHNWGPRFTSAAEARAYQLFGADAVNQSIGPEASAMREIGACFISASYIVCYEESIVTSSWSGLDTIHADLAAVASRTSLLTIARAELSEACGCAALRTARPVDYAQRARGRPSG